MNWPPLGVGLGTAAALAAGYALHRHFRPGAPILDNSLPRQLGGFNPLDVGDELLGNEEYDDTDPRFDIDITQPGMHQEVEYEPPPMTKEDIEFLKTIPPPEPGNGLKRNEWALDLLSKVIDKNEGINENKVKLAEYFRNFIITGPYRINEPFDDFALTMDRSLKGNVNLYEAMAPLLQEAEPRLRIHHDTAAYQTSIGKGDFYPAMYNV